MFPSHAFVMQALEFLATLFIFVVGLTALALMVVYALDVTQKRQSLRRNYPVIVHFRYLFERLGPFFRQYFFAMDREELPFNRVQRSWVYRAAKDLDNTVAFGSTRDLSRCAKLAGCWLNTGEGGLSPWHLEGGGDLMFQIGTAKFGVRDGAGKLDEDRLRQIAAHHQVRMFEIKLSQGAKPGKGGILPGVKITPEIASIRGVPVGQDAISPNRHVDIRDNGELLEMNARLRRVTGKPTGLKAVLGGPEWLDDLFALIRARGLESAPDFITVDGAEGGTGAAPQALIDEMGLPLRETLPLLVDKLMEYGLRERVKVIASGKLVTPADVAWAQCAGADFTCSARGFMFALGCIQSLRCNRSTCPTGITTHATVCRRAWSLPPRRSVWPITSAT